MARGSGYEEVWLLFFRFIREPFRSYAWAGGYIGIAVVLMVAQFLCVGDPEPVLPGVEGHFAALTNQLKGVFTLLFVLPAVAFHLVGSAGALCCVVRDIRVARRGE
jgi:hypothetical protein